MKRGEKVGINVQDLVVGVRLQQPGSAGLEGWRPEAPGENGP